MCGFVRIANLGSESLSRAGDLSPIRRGRMMRRTARRLLFLTLPLLWPALVGCSFSPQRDSVAAASSPSQPGALPQPAVVPVAMQNAAAQSRPVAGTVLAGLSPPRSASWAAAIAAVPPAQATLSAASGQPRSLAPSVAANGAAAKPAATAPSDDFDAAASAYPSVALFDLFRQNSNAQAQPVSPPLVSDSVTHQPATSQSAASQPRALPASQPAAIASVAAAPPAAQSATPTTAAAPAATSSDDNFDAAASAYPSVALFDLIRNGGNSQ